LAADDTKNKELDFFRAKFKLRSVSDPKQLSQIKKRVKLKIRSQMHLLKSGKLKKNNQIVTDVHSSYSNQNTLGQMLRKKKSIRTAENEIQKIKTQFQPTKRNSGEEIEETAKIDQNQSQAGH
jgi:hypothetical protein